MKIVNQVSLGRILWRVLKNPLAAEMSYEEAAEYALEFIRLLGAPVAYMDKTTPLCIEMHKVELPCDILTINGIRFLDTDTEGRSNGFIAMRESTDIYHIDPFENLSDQDTDVTLRGTYNRMEYTYSIQKGILFTSMREGDIEISYKGIMTDEDGYPLIPDNEKVLLGIEYYILSRYLEPLWMMGKITDKAFEFIQQKRYFYMPSAYTSLQMPSIDGMESLMNGLNRLIINTHAQESFFRKNGEAQRIRKYR